MLELIKSIHQLKELKSPALDPIITDYRQRVRQWKGREQERAELKELITKLEHNGRVHLWVWSRDCDCVEATRIVELPAITMAVEREINEQYTWAEGPVHCKLVSYDYALRVGPGG